MGGDLLLPYRAAHRVIQGVGGRFSHTGRARFAWDFAMDEGTEVVAVSDGIVVETAFEFEGGGPERRLQDRANLVVVDHGGNRFSVYQHLLRDGARVRAGQRVGRGQTLALSGNSGFSTRPHLHFAMIDYRNRSRAIAFADVPGGVPRAGFRYRSRNGPRTAPPSLPLTTLPRDAFAANGVILVVDLPARSLGDLPSVRVAGVATVARRRVVAFFLPRGSRRAIRWFFAEVGPGGRFALTLPRSSLAGGLSFALAATDDGHFHSDFSVPCFVAP